MATMHHYHIYMRPEPEGGYTVTVPALPGCVTFGKTIKEAKIMAHDAIQAYVASLKKHEEPVLADDGGLLAIVDVPSHA